MSKSLRRKFAPECLTDAGSAISANESRVFVYGTLKQGHSNHQYLDGARKVSDGYTIKKLLMMENHEFPIVFEQKRSEWPLLSVAGEIYEIDGRILSRLDRLEDLGGMYNRRTVKVRLSDGRVLPSFMYLGRPAYWENERTLRATKPRGGLYLWSPEFQTHEG